ncbi:MAG: hypothetical protein B7Y17_00450 [Sulfuricurvum sp. 24-42-5]|nr:MAG: hypothetical protein B7Y17_00450 [Sulfuricurvum sp. 24-42-5]
MILATTFTPYYCEVEDRVRLVINYADFTHRIDFWITRAFLLKLLPSMEEYFYSHATLSLLNSVQTPKSKESSATDGGTLAVTQKEAVLLEAVDMSYVAHTGMFEIRMRGKETEALAVLDEQLMMAVVKSIFAAAPHGAWGVSPHLLDSQ